MFFLRKQHKTQNVTAVKWRWDGGQWIESSRSLSPGLWPSSCCAHLKEEPPNVNVIYLWKVKILITFSIYLYFLVFYEVSKLNVNFFLYISSILFFFKFCWFSSSCRGGDSLYFQAYYFIFNRYVLARVKLELQQGNTEN